MKTNAVIRIVLWSIVIVVLVGILLWATGITPVRYRVEEAEASEAPQPVITEGITPFPVDPKNTYVVLETMNVRSAPTLSAEAIGVLEEGTEVTLTRMEEIAGKRWGYTTEPVQGWVAMDFIQSQSAPQQAPAAPVIEGPGTGYSAYPENLREISIEWALGDIFIQTADVEKLEVREVNQHQDKVGDMVVNSLSPNKLVIRYSESATWNMGLQLDGSLGKDLYITIPADFVLRSLNVNAASAALTVQNAAIQEVDFDGASGTCEFVNCDLDELDIDTASGDITFSGWLNELDCDAASASVRAVFENTPQRIDMDSMSGDLDITLPENAGFTVTMDSMSTDLTTDVRCTYKNGSYLYGDGACRITMDAISGDVYVRKPAVQETVPETTATP